MTEKHISGAVVELAHLMKSNPGIEEVTIRSDGSAFFVIDGTTFRAERTRDRRVLDLIPV